MPRLGRMPRGALHGPSTGRTSASIPSAARLAWTAWIALREWSTKHRGSGSPREGFDAERAGAGEEVEDAGVVD